MARNLASLLHSELIARATERASRYPAPKLTIKEQIAASEHNRELARRHYARQRNEYRDSCESQAVSHYTSVSILLEYNALKIEIDNVLSYIFDLHRSGRKLPATIRTNNFWKYYIAWSSKVKTKEEKQDAARIAYLHTIDEADHKATFGIGWRKDAADSIPQQPYNSFAKYLTKMDREHFSLLESRNDHGSMTTAYEVKWTDGRSSIARSR